MVSKLSDEDVLDGIESEGVGYWLTNHCRPEDIKNPELRKLAVAAKEALVAFYDKVEDPRGSRSHLGFD
jgi:hypothetical protein